MFRLFALVNRCAGQKTWTVAGLSRGRSVKGSLANSCSVCSLTGSDGTSTEAAQSRKGHRNHGLHEDWTHLTQEFH